MKILMISDFYPPHVGGIERHVQALARELVKREHQVAVVTMQGQGTAAFEIDEGVHIYRVSGWNRLLTPFYDHADWQHHLPMPDPGIMFQLRKIIQREDPDIVHAQKWMLYSFTALKRWTRARLVITLHDYSFFCPTAAYMHQGQQCTGPGYRKCIQCSTQQYGKARAVLITSGMRLSSITHGAIDKYTAVSSALKEASQGRTGKPPKEIEVVPTFIADSVLNEAERTPRPAFLPSEDNYILFVGRQDSYKGLDVLLQAYKGLETRAPLVVITTGAEEDTDTQQTGVTMVRNIPHEQVMASWKHCVLGVVPSIWPEPFGQVALEAMACSKPVIASNTGGLADVVLQQQSGLLIEPGKVEALHNALRELLDDPAKRESMGKVGRERVQQFTVGHVANRIEKIYRELLND